MYCKDTVAEGGIHMVRKYSRKQEIIIPVIRKQSYIAILNGRGKGGVLTSCGKIR